MARATGKVARKVCEKARGTRQVAHVRKKPASKEGIAPVDFVARKSVIIAALKKKPASQTNQQSVNDALKAQGFGEVHKTYISRIAKEAQESFEDERSKSVQLTSSLQIENIEEGKWLIMVLRQIRSLQRMHCLKDAPGDRHLEWQNKQIRLGDQPTVAEVVSKYDIEEPQKQCLKQLNLMLLRGKPTLTGM